MPIQTAGPSAEQVKADLIGHVLTVGGALVWEFAALSEYEEFEIKNELSQANALEYDVSMRLKDFPTNSYFTADALIVYKKVNGKWELVSVVTKLFQQCGHCGIIN
ncbi:hypothetical protein ACFLVJ_00100 [Chloroflexota bacterium]